MVLVFALGSTNALDINWDAGTVTCTDKFLTGFENVRTPATGDIERAFIDYDRTGPRNEFRMKSGATFVPLGRISMDKRSQRALVEAINDGLRAREAADVGRGLR